jgi:hypothetical protein
MPKTLKRVGLVTFIHLIMSLQHLISIDGGDKWDVIEVFPITLHRGDLESTFLFSEPNPMNHNDWQTNTSSLMLCKGETMVQLFLATGFHLAWNGNQLEIWNEQADFPQKYVNDFEEPTLHELRIAVNDGGIGTVDIANTGKFAHWVIFKCANGVTQAQLSAGFMNSHPTRMHLQFENMSLERIVAVV